MYVHYFSKLANHQIRHQATHKVGCQPDDYSNLSQGFVWVCMGSYTHLITPKRISLKPEYPKSILGDYR